MWSDEIAATIPAHMSMAEVRPVADVDVSHWHESIMALKRELDCNYFDWLSAVDEADDGIRIIAHVWSVASKKGLLIRTLLTPPDTTIASIVDIYPGAAWHERETHEMFDVAFSGHKNMRPLLLPPEFEGHPLRKDFILASRVAKPWPGAKEPGGETAGRKRAPMRPPGVPAEGEWGKSL